MGDSVVRSAVRLIRSGRLGAARPGAPQPPLRRPSRPSISQRARSATGRPSSATDRSAACQLTVGEVNEAFAKAGNQEAADNPEPGDPTDTFIDLYVAPVSVPTIGRSLLGDEGYEQLKARLKPGQQAIVVAGDGAYSFKGSGYVRGGIFDRIELLQEGPEHPLPRPQPHAPRRPRGGGRAGPARDRPVRRAGGLHARPDRALAAAAARAAQRRRARQGLPDLRPRLHASRPVPADRAASLTPLRRGLSRSGTGAGPSRPRRRLPRRPSATRTLSRPGQSRSRSGSRSGRRTPSPSASPRSPCSS